MQEFGKRKMTTPFDEVCPVGTVFKHENGYWKTTGWPRLRLKSMAYHNLNNPEHYSCNVIKCNKNGKEFSQTNGFTLTYIMKNVLTVVPESVKVSTEGQADGIKKRRIQWLEAEILSHQTELAQLKKELGYE